MRKEEIYEKMEELRQICKKEDIDCLFIIEGSSCWSISHNEHIREVAKFHKETEDKCEG